MAAPETDEEAVEEIKDADAAMGRIPPDALKVASMVRWLHNPDVDHSLDTTTGSS